MSEADKMFEELGYIKESEYYYHIPEREEESVGKFTPKHKHIRFLKNSKEVICESLLQFSYEVNMQELKAINKKVEELGWNEWRRKRHTIWYRYATI